METIISQIIEFADRAHNEQKRKYTPDRYIVHPIRVMETCKKYTSDSAVLAGALLHDVLEDTAVTKEKNKIFFLR
jgi:(p)ppGpp synthase/HD superfamily hydrolase